MDQAFDPPDRLDREVWLLASVTTLGLVMSLIDTTAVIVAIEAIGRSFKATLSSVQWVFTGYLLSLSFAIPLSGWAVGRFGTKVVWMSAAGMFLAGSALAGAAWSLESLIVFRIIQGFGGGLLAPVGQSVLARAAGPRRMGRVMSLSAAPLLVGPIIGPLVGGLLVEYSSWRVIFYVNLPIGAVALLLAWRLLPSDPDRRRVPLDLRGLLILSPGFALLAYGLAAAGDRGLADATTLGCVAVGLTLVVAFVPHARRLGRRALVDVGLFARRSFVTSASVNVLFQMSNFGAFVITPLYFQFVRGADAMQAGMLVTSQGVGAAIAMPFAGRLTDRLGSRRLIPIGVALMLVGTFAFTQVGTDTPYALLVASQVARGVGLGFTMLPAMAAAFVSLSRDEIPGASTALSTIQRLGASLGAALTAVFLEQQLRSVVSTEQGGALASLGEMPSASQERLAAPLAAAFGHTFWLAFAFTALTVLPVFLMGPRRGEGPRDPHPVAQRAV